MAFSLSEYSPSFEIKFFVLGRHSDTAKDFVDTTDLLSISSLSNLIDSKRWAWLFADLPESMLVLELDNSLALVVLGNFSVDEGSSFLLDIFIFLTKLLILSVPKLVESVLNFIEVEDLTDLLSPWSRAD